MNYLETPPAPIDKADALSADLGDLADHVGYMLRRAQIAVFGDFSRSQRGPVASPGQFSVLAVIGRNPGLSQAQLCAALGIKRANLVAVIDHFESLGLARREVSATDRRSNALHLTPGGEQALRRGLEDQAEHEARVTRLLGAEGRAHLLEQLETLCTLGKRPPQ